MLHIAELRWSHLWPELSHKGFPSPSWKSSHNKQGSTDIMLLEKAPKSILSDDNMAHRKLVKNQKLFSFQQAASGVLHISSWNHKPARRLERLSHSCKKAQIENSTEQRSVPQSLPCCSSHLCHPGAWACSWARTLHNRHKTILANGAQPARLFTPWNKRS